jgi:tape measure domain-containing protein
MASLGDIVIGLRMDASQFSGGAMQARATLASIATAAAAAGTAMMMAAAATAAYGIKLAADAEQTAIAFEVMLGSQEKAKTMLGELKAYADKSPFSGADTNEFALQLVNYGIAGEKILPTIRMLGDVAAGNKEKFSGLARAFGQMSATGRLMGQDLNQFINAGFNPLQEIAAKTGESMSSLKKRMEDGGIGSDEVAEAFKRATSEGGRFFGMTERQSQTLSGQWSTFRDNMDTTLRDIGEAISTNLDLKGILQSTGQWLGLAGGFVKTYGKEIVSLAAIMGSLVAAVALTRAAMLAYSAVQSILIMKKFKQK